MVGCEMRSSMKVFITISVGKKSLLLSCIMFVLMILAGYSTRERRFVFFHADNFMKLSRTLYTEGLPAEYKCCN